MSRTCKSCVWRRYPHNIVEAAPKAQATNGIRTCRRRNDDGPIPAGEAEV